MAALAKRWLHPRRLLFLFLYIFAVVTFFEVCARVAECNEFFVKRMLSMSAASWRLSWINRHRKGTEIFYSFDIYHPTRGWALAPNLHNVHMPVYRDKLLNSNSRGFRATRDYQCDRTPGKKRILVFGDSFTFGEDVNDDETYSGLLGAKRPDVEVINFGVHGYGFDQMLIFLREEGVHYRPDVVILGFVYDDVARVRLSFRDYAKPHFLLKGGRLELTNSPVPTPEQTRGAEIYRPKLLDILSVLSEHMRGPALARMEGERLSTSLLEAFCETTRSVGAQPLFVYLPTEAELSNTQPGLTENEEFLGQTCSRNNISCLQLRPAFIKASQSGAKITSKGHWTQIEHAIAADTIQDYLQESGLIP